MISLALITCHVSDFICTIETVHLRQLFSLQETSMVECWSKADLVGLELLSNRAPVNAMLKD